ncbi:MAG: DUF4886 domain-containing protein [Planctomycetia bacterium]|nr:DUF4886 domain-containing protein [Planctomycetia bacterium]
MKNFLIFIMLLFFGLSLEAKEVKLLTIGSSFSDSGMYQFPKVAASVPDCRLIQNRACIGGSGMEKHCEGIDKSDADPAYKPYPYGKGYTLKDLLVLDKWDFVLLQPHFSRMSYDMDVELPYLERIINYVKKYAPQAEIVLQMSWSFHPTHPLINEGKGRFKDPDAMFDSIQKNYDKLGKKYNLRIIPAGLAIQYARHNRKKTEEPKVDRSKLVYPECPPPSPNYFTPMVYWRPDAKGIQRPLRDCVHLDSRGQYTQSCLWFAEFFGKPISQITYVPGGMSAKDGEYYRGAAQKALDHYIQPYKNGSADLLHKN